MTTSTTHNGPAYRRAVHASTAHRPAGVAAGHGRRGVGLPEQRRVREVIVGLDDRPVADRGYHQEAHHGYVLLRSLVAQLGGSARAIARDMQMLSAIYDNAAIFAPRLLPPLSHFNLAVASIERLGNGSDYQRQCLDELDDARAVGVLAATELGHGNDLLNLGTRAVWDRGGRVFRLHTPSADAVKFWPNIADPDVPKTVVVIARLIIDGNDEGVWPFVVRLRTTHGLAEGVSVVALPKNLLGPPMDHAVFRFDNAAVPADSLLCGQLARFDVDSGVFHCDLGRHDRFHAAIGSLQTGRALFAGAAAACGRAGWAITVRYATQRYIIAHKTRRLIDDDATQRTLISALARLYAATALAGLARRRLAEEHPSGPALAMLAKPEASDTAYRVLDDCLQLCAAQGLSCMNHLGDYILRVNGIRIAEGSNRAIRVASGRTPELAATGHIPAHADISHLTVLDDTDLPWWQLMLHEREQALVAAARTGEPRAVGECGPSSTANDIAVAVAERVAADALSEWAQTSDDPAARSLLTELTAVYCLERLTAHYDWYAVNGRLSALRATQIGRQLSTRYSALAPQLSTTLLDFVDIPRLPAFIDQPDLAAAWAQQLCWPAETS
ncbi:acyl-CoA dehydrogenase family protein [Nocardia sp. CNY236]|uniref:acyl-CoA dehydrogenase family protein n=1 Tax=Nocardia sp. CNY236 TaxID=1169152 RepID=UPI0018CBA6FD|nr:acyl-CoA dehydrogenase family protein [Nocardia sp. CNY236]